MSLYYTLFLLIFLLPNYGLTLQCYRCQTGYYTNEYCSNVLGKGYVRECNEPNAQCFESIQWFQNGALRLVVRNCWIPPNNNTIGGYCENYNNPVGQLMYCRNCTTDMCNTDGFIIPRPVCYF